MLKFLFFSLVCSNAALFAYSQGYLGNFKGNEREPARIGQQINTDKLRVISQASAGAQAPVLAPPLAEPALACTLIGNFSSAEARRFENLLEPLALGQRQRRDAVSVPEISSHIVFIPPQGSKEAAERKVAQLQELGVSNYFIINETPLKWGVSLGVFKSEKAARTLLAALKKQGVANAKVAGRTTQTSKQAYRLSALGPAEQASILAIAAKFPQQSWRNCP